MKNESDSELGPNTLINGRYKIVQMIAKGGMGRVYLAEDTHLRRKVALKLLSSEVVRDQELAQRFIHEAQNASRIAHPNVVTIFDQGSELESGRPFLVTEFVDGVTLKDYQSNKKPTLYELTNIALQVAEALTAAHQVGVVHRDIKPGNIMILPDGGIKVLDFGLSKFVTPKLANGDTESITPLAAPTTMAGVVLGTPSYMSPEQARNSTTDIRTDVFSFGIVLYQLATGELPFHGATAIDVIASILNDKYPPLEHYVPDPPEALKKIVFKCLQKDVEKRYQSFDEISLDLKELRQQVAPKLPEGAIARRAKLRRYVRRSIKIILAASIISLAFIGGYFLIGPSAPFAPGGPLAGVPVLLESDFDTQVSSSDVPVLVFAYFYSTDYGAQKTDAPTIGTVAQRYRGRLKVMSVDTYVNSRFRERFKIGSNPAAILFIRGVELGRLSGAFSEEAAVKFIEDNYQRDAPLIAETTANEPRKETEIEELIESDFKQKVLDSKVPVVLFVSPERSSPGPYQSIRSILQRIADENPSKIKILWLNTYDNSVLADRLKVADFDPHLFLFKSGKRRSRLDGNQSKEAITAMLDGYITSN